MTTRSEPPCGGCGVFHDWGDCAADAPEPPIVLDKDLNPIGFEAVPCPAIAYGPFLGIEAVGDPEGRKVAVRCSQIKGHDGPHFAHIQWGASE